MKLTRAEEEIMQIIWELGRCTVSDIRNYMEEKMQVEKPPHSTISTLVPVSYTHLTLPTICSV